MEPTVLGVVLDSSVVITAERGSWAVPALVELIQATHGEIEVSLSPVTVAELVHGIYRARSAEASARRRDYIEDLLDLLPVHPVTTPTARLVGQIEGQEVRESPRTQGPQAVRLERR